MNTPKDDLNLISKKKAKSINKKYGLNGPVSDDFIKFIGNEKYCRKDVIKLVDHCSRVIISNTLLSEELENNDSSSEESGQEELYFDDIDKAMQISSSFQNVLLICQGIFSAGLAYGKATYETELEEQFNQDLSTFNADKIEVAELKKKLDNYTSTGKFNDLLQTFFNILDDADDSDDLDEKKEQPGDG